MEPKHQTTNRLPEKTRGGIQSQSMAENMILNAGEFSAMKSS